MSDERVATRGFGNSFTPYARKAFAASLPEMRMTATPDFPCGVASAKMVF
jgi:hypothetical protein